MALPPTWYLFGSDHLPHRLLLLARMIDRETARQLQEEVGLSSAEWRVLALICTVGPASAADVGASFEADRAEVSRAVTRLTQAGLIARTQDSANRKKMILSPTDAGKALYLKARGLRQGYFQAIMDDLSATERLDFDGALNRVALRVDDLRQDRD
ncbi:MAG: MarR family transcriptional regulator [Sphingobium sp.]|nr:MarR family transcriptional regulator [Sphingobium sp.]